MKREEIETKHGVILIRNRGQWAVITRTPQTGSYTCDCRTGGFGAGNTPMAALSGAYSDWHRPRLHKTLADVDRALTRGW